MIVLKTKFSDAGSAATIPLAPYAQTIRDSSPVAWWQVDTAKITQSGGLISALAPLVGAGTLVQAAPANQPSMVASVAGDYPAARFDGATDVLELGTLPYTKTGAFSWCLIAKVREKTATQMIMSVFSASSQSAQFNIPVTRAIAWKVGGTTISSPAAAIEWGDTVCLIGSSDQTNIKMMLNGTTVASGTTDNNVTASILRIGAGSAAGLQPADMDLFEALIWQEDIITARPALCATLAAYARQIYGAGG